ncbi:DUF1801 domain-containing protein [Erysipelothrix sp. HDW6C]|uniref:DUF1801 domain-containing protein n=1 Tax=Erysipelothrix sp. HDW6C TaxID=2714930 RepID=UPI00140E37DD|nr:DUF1801 domain-containing protein [Erysipelothrix sp. HDW6C]QIK70356.1 DUF1801 domain-containing protein [Erysipelothrix sp. HDW6C]
MTEFSSLQIDERFADYDIKTRKILLRLRELIFEIAQNNPEIDTIREDLKWNQPSYAAPKSGTAVRLDQFDAKHVALFVNCQTSLVEHFRIVFPDQLVFSGNRAIVVALDEPLPLDALRYCIESALTYKLKKHV